LLWRAWGRVTQADQFFGRNMGGSTDYGVLRRQVELAALTGHL
jgi:hypothetical protein